MTVFVVFLLGSVWGAFARDVSRWLRRPKHQPTRIVAPVANRRASEVAALVEQKGATVIMADANRGWIQYGAAGQC